MQGTDSARAIANSRRRSADPGSGRHTNQDSPRQVDPASVAAWISDMADEMAQLATEARLDLLAYFLSMARQEADAVARAAFPATNAKASAARRTG